MLVLVDMDGVLADFEAAFLEQWRLTYPDAFSLEPSERKAFYTSDDYPEEYRTNMKKIHRSEGFYRNLPVIEGGPQALNAMLAAGHDVFICTAPATSSRYCAGEKMEWVREHLGDAWLKRTIIASDKTLVGSANVPCVLIDDRPEITGAMVPTWKHVVFDAPYNQSSPAPFRLRNWSEWPAMVASVEAGV